MIKLSKQSFAQAIVLLATATSVSFALPIYSASAQSTDRDNPTAITSTNIQGQFNGNDESFFYSFIAGPGEVKITVDLKLIGGGVSSAILQLYDETGSNEIGPMIAPIAIDRGGERKTDTIRFGTRQRVLMRITQGSGYPSTYQIRLSGAVEP